MTADPTETLRALMPFAATLGIDLLRYEPEEVRARLAWAPGLHKGRTLIVVETDIRDAQQRLAARVTQTQLVLAEAGK
jgi:acyl-coenzyme A thioesterase PaaI-like protein